jgi:hypothetical protein
MMVGGRMEEEMRMGDRGQGAFQISKCKLQIAKCKLNEGDKSTEKISREAAKARRNRRDEKVHAERSPFIE